jgi:hypothetical protein
MSSLPPLVTNELRTKSRSWWVRRWDAGTSVSGTSAAAAESSSVRHRWAAITTTLRQAQTPARTVPGSWFCFLSHWALFSFFFPLGVGGRGVGFCPPFLPFFFHGRFAPCFWYLGLFFPPSLRAGFGLCFAFFAPLFSVVASASYQVGPTSSLGDKTGAQRDVTCSKCDALFRSMACLVINSIARFFRLFHLVVLLALFPLMRLGRYSPLVLFI